VPEDRRIFSDLTVEENLLVGSKGGGRWSASRVYEYFPKLAQMAGRRGGSLVRREQQMLTVARTLMVIRASCSSTSLPRAGPRHRPGSRPADRRAAGEGLTILLSEQNLKFAARLADRAYIIEKARSAGKAPWAGCSRTMPSAVPNLTV